MEVRMKMEGRRKANQKNNFHVLRTVSRIVLLQRNYKTIINFQLNWFFLTLSSTQIKSTTKLNTSIEWISFLSKEKDWLLCLCKSQNTELPPIEAISLQLLKLKLSFNKNHTLKISLYKAAIGFSKGKFSSLILWILCNAERSKLHKFSIICVRSFVNTARTLY